ncbi:dolichyl-phosphate-mannose-protein mannosyltransferase [Sphingomonas sp. Leaf17]|uniref:phospholipid carrier-dependent glycosyltransferase n=1 Tax=Sphingomonas sp. Leaf17 TaxID=1735683 RepID=UPI0006FFFACC|nr:phospholipid carrier-dependent glycosyltransferase [Sphingomonas sp. Leaf17]KQM67393.1 dolichyl-phosphate-mannose-protein mannosyltransferase [Sphingomonas sp. Leaf17]
MRPILNTPRRAAAAIAVLAQALFSYRLTVPSKPMFDEIHYLPAARALLALGPSHNPEHPLLGKTLIAAGIALFGDGPLGWRILSSIAGTATVLGVFWILWLMVGRLRPAVIGSLFALMNFTVFVQARIAMLDGFLACFVVLAVAMLLWSARAGGRGEAWRRWLGGAVLLGLAVGVKWTAVPYVAFAGVAFVVIRRRHPTSFGTIGWFAALASLGVGSVATYFATFLPAFFYHDSPMTPARLIPFQREMWGYQTQVLPAHTYQSSWWTWPLDLRPIWYLYEPVDGAVRGVLMIGNPVVMWGGLVAVGVCLWMLIRRRDAMAGAAAGLWAGSLLIWAIIPKSLGFFYYYYLSSIWLCIVLAIAFARQRPVRHWDESCLALATIVFVYFHPILSAAELPAPDAFRRWMWLGSWA